LLRLQRAKSLALEERGIVSLDANFPAERQIPKMPRVDIRLRDQVWRPAECEAKQWWLRMRTLHGTHFIGLVVFVITLGSVGAAEVSKPPYRRSPVIERAEFDFKSHRRLAPGSDNWPITWADDGHLYTAWGDGGGFGGTNQLGRVSLGIGRIEGPRESYTGRNIWGGHESDHRARFTGKSYGILCVGGVLHMWVAPQPNPHLQSCRIASSTDHGATWNFADWSFRFGDGLTIPTFLQFGRDNAGARDEYVYSYFIEPQWGPGAATKTRVHTFDVHRPGRIHLSRVRKDAILQRDRYEFFAGMEPTGPSWSTKVPEKSPVFADDNGVGWNLSVSYNSGLKRYLLITEHSETHAGKLGIFDAPEPWGPWTTVAYDDAWGAGHLELSTFHWVLTPKWINAEGTRFTLVFTGNRSNDAFNSVAGTFLLRAYAQPLPSAGESVR
jgi:hypothetical protein